MNNEHRVQVNSEIKSYWLSFKKRYILNKIKKSKVPSFTRINSAKFLRLGKKWRYPRGRHSDRKVYKPSIGYKRPQSVRFRRKADGLLFKLISCQKELNNNLKEREVYAIKSFVGAMKRRKILEKAKELDLPLYIS